MKELLPLAHNILYEEIKSLCNLNKRLDDNFLKSLELLYNCKNKVIITGVGKSGIIGKKISATFCSTGTPSIFLHPIEALHGDSGIIQNNDIIINISNSGESKEIISLIDLVVKKLNIKSICLTGNINSTLAKKSDTVINIGVEKEACILNLAPTCSTTTTLVMGDILAICLMKKRNFKKEDFLKYHPLGKLGETKKD